MGTQLTRTVWVSLAAFCLGLFTPGEADGLTVYRIGAGFPADESRPGVDLVHLTWREASTGFGGGWVLVDMDESRIAPVLLKPDRNIARDAAGLGGGAFGAKWPVKTKNEHHDWAVDGELTTALEEVHHLEGTEYPLIGVDLGGTLPINRVVFYPRPEFQDRFVKNFRLYVFDGDLALLRDPWRNLTFFDLVVKNEIRDPHVEVTMPTRLAHTVLMVIGHGAGIPRPWEIAEFEIYGDGYPPRASYTSRVLDLGRAASLGQIRWQGAKDRGARVRIQTRSGADEDPNRYWRRTGRGDEVSFRDEDGRPLTLGKYDRLLVTEQAGTTHDQASWNFWSAPYAFGDSVGTAIASPRPQRFVQLQLQFENNDRAGGELSFLEFEVTAPPVVQEVIGEVWPVEAEAGVETEFVYAFKPTITSVEPGFDRLVLNTPGELIAIDSVHVNEDAVAYGLSGDQLPGHQVEIALPRMEAADSQKLVEIFLRARVFRFGTVFEGELFDSQRPGELGQAVTDGDAIFRFDGNRLSVGVNLSGALLEDVRVTTPVVTPNGDGINDDVGFEYLLLQLAEGQVVTVDIFDLSGRRVRRLHEGLANSGGHVHTWDGRGETGPLSPGLYLYRVAVDADSRQDERSGVIGVFY